MLARRWYQCRNPIQKLTSAQPQFNAARLGLQDGALAEISSQTTQGLRSAQVPVQISAEMMPGVVSLPHGWGHDLAGTRLQLAAQRPGANLNNLLDDQCGTTRCRTTRYWAAWPSACGRWAEGGAGPIGRLAWGLRGGA